MTSIHFFHPIGKKLYRTPSKPIESDRNRSTLIVVDKIIRGPLSDAYGRIKKENAEKELEKAKERLEEIETRRIKTIGTDEC